MHTDSQAWSVSGWGIGCWWLEEAGSTDGAPGAASTSNSSSENKVEISAKDS